MASRRKKEVSEKSLELNVCAEFLRLIRCWPGCDRALWYGLTQAEEKKHGLDEMIKNVGAGVSVMLQFKAPWATSQPDDLYKFSINETQHQALECLANQHPDGVYYVFPLYSKWSKANQHAPRLAQDTWLVPVSSLPLSSLRSLSTPATGSHRVELERIQSKLQVTAHSPPIVGEAVNAGDYFADVSRGQPIASGSAGVPSEQLLEWVEGWRPEQNQLQAILPTGSRLPRFRGLNVLYVPTS